MSEILRELSKIGHPRNWPSIIFIPKATQAASAAQAEQDRLKELLQEVQYVAAT